MRSPAISAGLHGWRLDNTYVQLPAGFYSRRHPTPVQSPQLLLLNTELAQSLGLDAEALQNGYGLPYFSGNQIPPGADPIAQAYAGHQFGHFTMLGDGRAILLGEQIAADGMRYDVQLKGAGLTPYSRRGDGRAALGPMLREYAVSEAMHALGVPTTRSLAVVATGETVRRDEMLPGAILTRVAKSHIRVGTFEYASALQDIAALKVLADYAIARHFPQSAAAQNPYLSLLEAVAERQASLIAQWMHIGFIHGVMNTDNMSIAGETIDYGPCAFMDTYDSDAVFSSIDHHGRYAYSNQPTMAWWNLARFAETLLPLIDGNQKASIAKAEAVLEQFESRFKADWLSGMRRKLGLLNELPEDDQLITELLAHMENTKQDFTYGFRRLTDALASGHPGLDDIPDWNAKWSKRLENQAATTEQAVATMQQSNPAVIPRNYQLELALQAAESGDISVFLRFLAAVQHPFSVSKENEIYRLPPNPQERIYQTFCGT